MTAEPLTDKYLCETITRHVLGILSVLARKWGRDVIEQVHRWLIRTEQ